MKNFIIDEQKDDQKLLPIDYSNSIQNLIIVNNTVNNTNYNSIINNLRNLFQNATNNSTCQHCINIWKLYFEFEVNVSRDLKRATGVLTSSLKYCPWSKDLHMLLFKLNNDLNESEYKNDDIIQSTTLLQVLIAMQAYGIRLRIDPTNYINETLNAEMIRESQLLDEFSEIDKTIRMKEEEEENSLLF